MEIAKGLLKLRRNVAGLSLVTMIATMFVGNVASAATFTDVPPSNQWYTFVEQLASAGAIDTTAGKFNPDSNASRGMIASVVVKMAGYTLEDPATPSFSDVAKGSMYYKYVETARTHGVLNGYKDVSGNLTGVFGVNDNLTREQMAKIVVNAKGLAPLECGKTFPDVSGELAPFVTTLYCWSVIDGYDNATVFHPTWPVTKGALAKFVAVAWNNPVKRTPVQNNSVTATLATTTPAVSVLVNGQATADLAHFAFNGSGVVTNVTLKRIGVSADSTPSNVYLFDGATRLTDAASVSSNGMVTFNTANGIFTVNGLKTISVKSDIADNTSGQTVGMQLVSFAVNGSTSTVNVAGNIHSIADATLATITAGSVTPSGAVLNPGPAVTLWQSTLNISERDVWMKRLALRQVGSAQASAFANFKLYVGGVQVGAATGIDAMGYVTFDMKATPVELKSGSRVVRVDADIVSGASRTVQLSLRQAADVDFVDSSFGVNVTPTSTPWTAAAASTISGANGGTLTIEKDVTSPSTNVTLGGNDVNLGTFKVTAYGEAIKIETLKAGQTFTDGGTVNAAATLRNARLLINGVQYGSSATLVDAGTGTSFTVNYTVMPGTPVLVELHADVYDNDGTGSLDSSDSLLAKIVVGSSNAQRVDSLGSFNAPAVVVPANTLAVASASATLVKNGTYANQNTTLPATNFKIGSWNLTGSSTEDILLTTLSVDVDEVVSTEFDEGDITNMYLVVKNGSTIVAQPSPLATVGATDNNFSINYTLLKNANVSIELFGNLADDGADGAIDAADSFRTDLTVTGTAMVSGTAVSASGGDVTGQTVAYGAATLTATQDPSTPSAAIVYDNQTVATAAFRFSAVTSGYNVTDLTLTLASATVANTVMLYDGATLIATQPGASSVVFSGLSWNIPANTIKTLTVKLGLGTVLDSGSGTTAGASLLTTLAGFTATSTSTGVADASGNDAGPSISNEPAGNVMYAYAAVPTIATVALATDKLNAGTNTFAKFTVTANGGPIAWQKIKFNIARATTDAVLADTTTFTLWDENNVQIEGTSTGLATAGDADATCDDVAATDTYCTIRFVTNTEQQVSTSKTYTLKGTISGTLTDGDYFSTSVLQPSGFLAPDDYTAAAAIVAQTFIWSDMTGIGHDSASVTVTDWNNGYLVKTLPLDGQTLTRSL